MSEPPNHRQDPDSPLSDPDPQPAGRRRTEKAIEAIKRDWEKLRNLPPSVAVRLKALAESDPLNVTELDSLYLMATSFGGQLLTHVVLLEEDDFESLLDDLGEEGKGLVEVRKDYLALSDGLRWIRMKEAGRINSWKRARTNPFLDSKDLDPWLDFYLFDDIGENIFHSRAPVQDFTQLARGLVKAVAEASGIVAENALGLTDDFVENERSTIKEIRKACDDYESDLKRASKSVELEDEA